MSDSDTGHIGDVDSETAAQLEEADSGDEAPSESAPEPDAMSEVIEEQDSKTEDSDPESLSEGQEW